MAGSTPRVLIVSGPSGSGKSTLVQNLHGLPGLVFSVSSTTRPRRLTESPGKCYDFITEAEFKRRIDSGGFLEYAQVFGRHWYGTPRKQLEDARRAGLDLVLEIDVQGARQEIASSAEYDFVVVNDDLERASDELRAIAVASRCRRRDNDERLRKILESFGGS